MLDQLFQVFLLAINNFKKFYQLKTTNEQLHYYATKWDNYFLSVCKGYYDCIELDQVSVTLPVENSCRNSFTTHNIE